MKINQLTTSLLKLIYSLSTFGLVRTLGVVKRKVFGEHCVDSAHSHALYNANDEIALEHNIIDYPISPNKKVSIIILNRDRIDLLAKCIDSIISLSTYRNYDIVIVENNSTLPTTRDYYTHVLNAHAEKIVVMDYGTTTEFNFSALNNWAVNQIKSEYLLFLNNDTEVITPNWIEEMLLYAQKPEVGAVGVMLYYPDDTIQHCGFFIGLDGHCASHHNNGVLKDTFKATKDAAIVRKYSAVTAACLMIKRQDFLDVGGFDEETFKVGLNDIDVCLKLREKDKFIVFTPYAELYHNEGSTRGRDHESTRESKRLLGESIIFREKWKPYFTHGDPYYFKFEE